MAVSMLRTAAATIRRLSQGFRSNHSAESALTIHRMHWIKFNLEENNIADIDQMLNDDKKLVNANYGKGDKLIHLACHTGSVDTVKLLIKLNADLNVMDAEGNTPVHIAVINGNPIVLRLILKKGAVVNAVNTSEMAPIHLAVQQENITLVKILLDHGADPDQIGYDKQTALHFAAATNQAEIVTALMAYGAEPLRTDRHGKYPVHVACKMANPASLKAIIDGGVAQGYSTSRLLSVGNRDGKLPIHAAVNSGNVQVTQVCMEAGSPVKSQQKDGMTCVHLACSLGHLQMVQVMAQMQPESFADAISITDSAGMTPLHRVVIFDQTDIIKFLLQKGAEIEAEDDTGKTPLLMATAKGNWSSVKELLAHNANTRAKDIRHRNLLHIAIRSRGGIRFMEETFGDKLKMFVNEHDEHGWTPFHFACYDCHIMAVSLLMKHGVTLNVKDNGSRTPLHLAATQGCYKTCQLLLDGRLGNNKMINDVDTKGRSALHMASENGHIRVVRLLLSKGSVSGRDSMDNTPLHYACSTGWHTCVQSLLEHYPLMLNATNTDGDTALHMAGKNGHATATSLLLTLGAQISRNHLNLTFMDYIITGRHYAAAEAVISHERWEEAISLPSKYFGRVFLGLVECLPDACEKVLNRCYETSDSEAESPSFWIHHNFTFLEIPLPKKNEDLEPQYENFTPFYAMRKMIEWNRVDCLAHPVCAAFLKSKWFRYGGLLFTTQQCIYVIFILCCTHIVVLETTGQLVEGSDHFTHVRESRVSRVAMTTEIMGTCFFVTIYSIISFAKDLLLLFVHRKRDTFEITKLMAWTLYISSIIFTLMPLMDIVAFWQFESGVVTVFLGWIYLLIMLQRLDFFGIYVVMFLEICNTFVRVLCVFFVINVAFSFAFYMLLYSHPSGAFSTPLLSMMKTFMMLVEQDYMDVFVIPYVDGNDATLPSAPLAFTMLVIYLLVMPILVMNLLIGLAVGDIEQVRKDAQLKRLTTEVECYFHIESKLPECLQRRIAVYSYKFFPNIRRSSFFKMFPFSKDKISHTEQTSDVALLRQHLAAELERQNEWLSKVASMVELNCILLKRIVRGSEQGQDGMEYEDVEQDEGDHEFFRDHSFSTR